MDTSVIYYIGSYYLFAVCFKYPAETVTKQIISYMAQVQYSMWVTRKDAWYFANYDPRMKREGLHYVVVERDEKYMANFDEMVPEFIEKMDEALAEIGFVFGEQWR